MRQKQSSTDEDMTMTSHLLSRQRHIKSVTQATCMNYDQYYDQKEAPEKNSEGSINVIGFDGIGVPVIKSEAVKLKARLGKGEKRQKKKEAMVGVSYTIDPKQRTPEEVVAI